jgi:hypothetical protein
MIASVCTSVWSSFFGTLSVNLPLLTLQELNSVQWEGAIKRFHHPV